MTLPVSRNRTYTPSVTPVSGADLNDLQDQAIAQHRGYQTIISPASLPSGSHHDWAPPGIDNAQVVRITHGVGTANITGISAGQVHGRRLTLLNVSVNTLVLQDDNAGSIADNRILCPGNSGTDDFQFQTNGAVELMYDGISQRWRVIATSP